MYLYEYFQARTIDFVRSEEGLELMDSGNISQSVSF